MDETKQALALAEVRELVSNGSARLIRERAHLTRGDTARAVGVSDACIEAWEAKRRRPTGSAALRYRAFLRSLERVVGAT